MKNLNNTYVQSVLVLNFTRMSVDLLRVSAVSSLKEAYLSTILNKQVIST